MMAGKEHEVTEYVQNMRKEYNSERGDTMEESLLKKFGLSEGSDDPAETGGGDSFYKEGDEEMDESLMLKYGFMSESTAKLFEKFGLLIDEANVAKEELCSKSLPTNVSVGEDKLLGSHKERDSVTESPGLNQPLRGGESKVNEDGEFLPPQASGQEVPVAPAPTPSEIPTTADGNPVADSGEDAVAVDYTTPQAAMSQIAIDYPEEPLTTTAMVFADSFINDPMVYKQIRKMVWSGVWTDTDGIIAQAKVVGDYRSFSPEIVKLLTDRLGNGAKYKLGRDNGPTIGLVLRDPDFSISLSGLKELVNATDVIKTGQPGEVVLKF
jgi:hypothetical protein